jgi:hypothetical protein
MINYTSNSDENIIVRNYRKKTRHYIPKNPNIINIELDCYFRKIEGKILTIGINTHLLAQEYNIIYMFREPINDIEVVIPLDWRNILKQDNFKTNEQFKIRMDYYKENKYFKLTNRSR